MDKKKAASLSSDTQNVNAAEVAFYKHLGWKVLIYTIKPNGTFNEPSCVWYPFKEGKTYTYKQLKSKLKSHPFYISDIIRLRDNNDEK